MFVRKAKVDDCAHPFGRDCLEPLQRAAGQGHGRLARPEVDHAHVAPEDTATHSRAQSLGAGLLRREALGVRGRPVRLALRAGPFDFGEDAVREALAEPRQALLHSPDVGQVRPDPDDHAAAPARASSIKARMRWMAGPRPVKIASPIRKWPMLSSTTSGIAATALTVSK